MRDESELRAEFKKLRVKISEGITDIGEFNRTQTAIGVIGWVLGAPTFDPPTEDGRWGGP